MIFLRKAGERHHVQREKSHTWLTFSPHDRPGPLGNGFGVLAGLDEVWLSPGEASEPYPGNETETITYVYKGTLARGATAHGQSVIHAGEFLRLALGDGVLHSETNASASDWAHLYRISLRQPRRDLVCAREQERYTTAQRRNTRCLVASAEAREGVLRLHQDVFIYSSVLNSGHHLVHELAPARSAWLHMVCGVATLSGVVLDAGDGAGFRGEALVSLTVHEACEILLLDLGPQSQARPEAVPGATHWQP